MTLQVKEKTKQFLLRILVQINAIVVLSISNIDELQNVYVTTKCVV